MEITLGPKESAWSGLSFLGSRSVGVGWQSLFSIAECRMHACKTFPPFSPVSCHRRHTPGLELFLKAKRAGEAHDLWSYTPRPISPMRHPILTPGKACRPPAEPHINPCLSAVPLGYTGGQTRSSICLVKSQEFARKSALRRAAATRWVGRGLLRQSLQYCLQCHNSNETCGTPQPSPAQSVTALSPRAVIRKFPPCGNHKFKIICCAERSLTYGINS